MRWTRQPGDSGLRTGVQETTPLGEGEQQQVTFPPAPPQEATDTPASAPQSFRALLFLTVCLRLSRGASPSSSFSCKDRTRTWVLVGVDRDQAAWP